MIATTIYNRVRAVEYARRWALSRNPLFYDFTGGGGNCTNFVSQAVLAGSLVMNPSEIFGWYYRDLNDRAPAWTGVREFYEFMLGIGDFAPKNERVAPFASEVGRERVEIGDVVQLYDSDDDFYHTLIVSSVERNDLLVCAHSNDALDRRLSSYSFDELRFIHIDGVRVSVDEAPHFNPLHYDLYAEL